jgi:hypothetical protein
MLDYITEGQMSILDFLEPTEHKFCFDDDINQIVNMLDDICLSNNIITNIKKEWEVWEHVPQYGYRLSYNFDASEEPSIKFYQKLSEIIEFAKKHKIELSPYEHDFSEKDWMFNIYSTFLDERKKIKKATQLRFA